VLCLPILCGAVVIAALFGGTPDPRGGATPSPRRDIPASVLLAYQRAATACPGLSWTVLAAIGTVESDNGQSPLPGIRSGHNAAGAAGPMQFEPTTFARYARPVPPHGADPPSPYDPVDAAFAAARLLCANGAAGAGELQQAIFAYNHSRAYVTQVLHIAAELASAPETSPDTERTPPRIAVAFARSQVGTPYRWGGESPGVGFDCSGLVQAGMGCRRCAAAAPGPGPVRPGPARARREARPAWRPGLLRAARRWGQSRGAGRKRLGTDG
jgi:hypothetical protein